MKKEITVTECLRLFSIVAGVVGMGLTTFFISGCSSEMLSRPKLDPSINYQRDITFHVSFLKNKTWSPEYLINGMGVMPEADSYKIKVLPPGKADMITVTSCHREEKMANPPKDGTFKNTYTFQIDLVQGLESKRTCPIDVGVYEKEAGRHGWATLAIETQRERLPAMTKCNGRVKQYNGVSVCQAKSGLLQKYEFKTPVAVATIPGCYIPEPKDGMNYEFVMPSGSCTIYFVERKNPDNIHQANLFGFDTIPIRGVL